MQPARAFFLQSLDKLNLYLDMKLLHTVYPLPKVHCCLKGTERLMDYILKKTNTLLLPYKADDGIQATRQSYKWICVISSELIDFAMLCCPLQIHAYKPYHIDNCIHTTFVRCIYICISNIITT